MFMFSSLIKAKQWHQLGLMTTKREKKADYKFFFKALRKGVLECTGEDYRPSILVADSAGSITNGFMSAMNYGSTEDFIRVICWQHVKRNVEKHLNLVNAASRDSMRVDIGVLQACQSKELFDKAVDLFQLKWVEESEFLKYFVKTWLRTKQRGWYQVLQ